MTSVSSLIEYSFWQAKSACMTVNASARAIQSGRSDLLFWKLFQQGDGRRSIIRQAFRPASREQKRPPPGERTAPP